MADMLVAQNLTACYRTRRGEDVTAVDDVSLALAEGEVLGIAGESGCGKSTLGRALSAIYDPPMYCAAGRVFVEGDDIYAMSARTLRREVLGTRVSYIPQSAMNSLNPTRRIGAFVRDVVRTHYPDVTGQEALNRARDRLESLSLSARVLRTYPFQLSGGMQQRTVVAISTLLDPAVLIADEPTSALDVSTQRTLVAMLRDLLARRIARSLIFITHDLTVLRHVCDRIAVMYAGEFVEVGPAEKVIFQPVHPYTKALVGSVMVPEPGARVRQPAGLPGTPPDLRAVPAGCRFGPRCPDQTPACRAVHGGLQVAHGRLIRCPRILGSEGGPGHD
jgi:peptide/nickel transport system ATP-binding protein